MDEKVAKTPRPHMLDADEVAELLRIKKGSAYEVIRRINAEQEARGRVVIRGRVRSDVFFAVGKTFAYSVNSVVKGLQLCAVGLKEKVVIAVYAVAVARDKPDFGIALRADARLPFRFRVGISVTVRGNITA